MLTVKHRSVYSSIRKKLIETHSEVCATGTLSVKLLKLLYREQ